MSLFDKNMLQLSEPRLDLLMLTVNSNLLLGKIVTLVVTTDHVPLSSVLFSKFCFILIIRLLLDLDSV